jgi:hypothetical protein
VASVETCRLPPRASIENGNVLGQRPVVRQSKIYRVNESGNAMKAALGHDTLQWETERLEGVFAGQGVYDAVSEKVQVSESTARASEGGGSSRAAAAATTPTPPARQKGARSSCTPSPAQAGKPAAEEPSGGAIPRDAPGMGPLQQAAAARKAKLEARRQKSHSPANSRTPSARTASHHAAAAGPPRGEERPVAGVVVDGARVDGWAGEGEEEGDDDDEEEATPLERMRMLKGLYDDGLITQDEFEHKRKVILEEL